MRDGRRRAELEDGHLLRLDVVGWVFALGLLVLAEGAVRLFDLSDSVAEPSDAVGALVGAIADGSLSGQVATTLGTYAQGLVLAIAVGVALGVAIGSSRTLEDASSTVVEFLRPIPAVAFIPLAIFWFGSGTPTIRFLVAYAAAWPILIHTVYGVRGVDRMHYDVAATSGVEGAARVVRVSLPAALPSIVTGIRISAALGLVVCVTAEYFVGSQGVGDYLNDQRVAYRLPELYGAAILTGLLGLAIDALLRNGERRVVFWTGEEQARRR